VKRLVLRHRKKTTFILPGDHCSSFYFIKHDAALIHLDCTINLLERVSRWRNVCARGAQARMLRRTLRKNQKLAKKPIVPVTKKNPKENRSLQK
jgi:hypothetical protein